MERRIEACVVVQRQNRITGLQDAHKPVVPGFIGLTIKFVKNAKEQIEEVENLTTVPCNGLSTRPVSEYFRKVFCHIQQAEGLF